MSVSDTEIKSIETRSLRIGMWGNLIMAAAGVIAAHMSRSDALLVDGLYSGVNFVSAIVATQVAASVLRPANRLYPFGYSAYEAIYVNFRSLILVGIIAFAGFNASKKIAHYATGGDVPELVFGPILIYSVMMVAICVALALVHRRNWQRTEKRSEVLRTEASASTVDGVISGGAGAGLVGTQLLEGTFLSFLVPISDSIVVLVMAAFVIRAPLHMFFAALREIAGESADKETRDKVRKQVEQILTANEFKVFDVAVTKLGRSFAIVPFAKPKHSVDGDQVDALTRKIEQKCLEELGETRTAIVITSQPPWPEDVNASPQKTSEAGGSDVATDSSD